VAGLQRVKWSSLVNNLGCYQHLIRKIWKPKIWYENRSPKFLGKFGSLKYGMKIGVLDSSETSEPSKVTDLSIKS
jgi:hypothetical protein